MPRMAKYSIQQSEANCLSFESAVQSFLTHRRIEGLATTTLTFYSDIFRFLSKNGFPDNLTTCTATQIEQFIFKLLDEGMKPVTVNGKLRALKALFNFCKSKHLIQENPMDGIKFIKHEKNIIRTLETQHISSLLRQCADGTFAGVRDCSIILLLLDTGARASELLGLRVTDINTERGEAVVMGKGRKARRIFFSDRTGKATYLYLQERGNLTHDVLFVAESNEPLHIRSLQDRLKDLGNRAGITDVRVSPHTFRHTMAKLYIKNGGDIFTLQKLLGHTTIDMVRNYVEMFGDDVAEAHARFSPVDHIKLTT